MPQHKPGPMRYDTQRLLLTGTITLTCGVVAAALAQWVCGGIGRQGPHTNGGWLCLMIAMGCLPTAALSLLLGLSKLYSDRRRTE